MAAESVRLMNAGKSEGKHEHLGHWSLPMRQRFLEDWTAMLTLPEPI